MENKRKEQQPLPCIGIDVESATVIIANYPDIYKAGNVAILILDKTSDSAVKRRLSASGAADMVESAILYDIDAARRGDETAAYRVKQCKAALDEYATQNGFKMRWSDEVKAI